MSSLPDVFGNMDLDQLRNALSYINGLIVQKSRQDNHDKLGVLDQTVVNVDVNNYVEYHPTFCQDERFSLEYLAGELESLNFKTSTSTSIVQNKFISMLDEPYSWGSFKGPVINEPLRLDDFPVIKSLLDCISSCISL